jgi:D-galactarolactone isomerase
VNAAQSIDRPAPHSAGTRAPKLAAPAGACDCHMHIFDPRFSPSPHWTRKPPDAPLHAYRALQRRIGTTRTVIVNPSTYGTDNGCTLDALAKIGAAARGVAVVDTDVPGAELRRMADLGVRGIRVNFVSPQSWGATTAEMLETLSRRVADLGWHVQVFMLGDQIVQLADMLRRLPTPVVIDHLGRLPQPAGIDHAAFAVIRTLLDGGRAWMKLSGAYMDTRAGPPGYSDVSAVARAFVKAAPERMVWGSDWPHTTAERTPDDAVLFDLLAEWAPDDATRHRILVDNPAALYGFPHSR